MRLVEFSVQGNHIHLLVEAANRRALTRGMQGLAVRLARGVNRASQRRGKVFVDRYFARALRTLGEVKKALHYVHRNWHKHQLEGLAGAVLDDTKQMLARWIDPFSSAAGEACWYFTDDDPDVPELVKARARTWLLQQAGGRWS